MLFKVRHLGIRTVTGELKTFEATFGVDPKDLSTLEAEATFDVASIDTREEDRDNHLRSGDFFDAENHPQIRFVSRKAEVAGENRVKLSSGARPSTGGAGNGPPSPPGRRSTARTSG